MVVVGGETLASKGGKGGHAMLRADVIRNPNSRLGGRRRGNAA